MTDLTAKQQTEQTEEVLELERLRLREDQLAEAMITDPLRFEEMLRNGELSDDVDAADEDDELDADV